MIQKLMHCAMCTASIRLTQCTAIHACTNVAIRVYYYTALHVGFTILVPMSNCMQCLIFFTCISFVLYLKFIKYQIYYGLIFYLSLNDSLNLKCPPAIALTCKMTQQIIKKERTNSNNKYIFKTASYKLKTIITRFLNYYWLQW